jgi:hypothetical protein
MSPSTHTIPSQQAASVAAARPSAWPRGWRAAAGLTSVAAGGVILAGAFMPWVEAFAGLVQVSGVQGSNGRILAAAGAAIVAAGLYQLARGGQLARWLTGLAGFGAVGFSGYLLIQLARSMRVLGGDSMVVARGGPGLWVVAAGSVAAFATLFFPPSSQATLRRNTERPALAWIADRESAGIRRGLQVALGSIWLCDAALQYQPSMFSKAFPAMMLVPSAMGQPAFVSGPVLAAGRLVAGHVVVANALFATVQLALAAGLLFRATARAALAGTIAWSLAVWWLAEGLGEVFGGMASPLTGAPGAAVLYAFLAVLIWPADRPADRPRGQPAVWPADRPAVWPADRPADRADRDLTASVADGSPLGRWARLAWFALWGGMAALLLLAPASSATLTARGGTQAAIVTIGLAAAFALAAVGVFVSAQMARPALLVAVIAALVIWAAGENFGGLFSGSATDPNSGPLLVLIALAFWPARTRLRQTTGEALRPNRSRRSLSSSPK